MAIVEVSISPLGTGEPGVSRYVAGCLKILRASGLSHQLTPMGTVIEGPLDEVFRVIREMMESPFAAGARRVSTLIKVDERRDRVVAGMQEKVATVERHLEASGN